MDYTSTDPTALIAYTYAVPGTYQARITVTDNQNMAHTQTVAVVVNDLAQMEQIFQSIWSGINGALAAKDKAKALLYLNAQARVKYGPIFEALLPYMPGIVASYSPLQRVSISGTVGEYAVNRVVNGKNRIFLIYFLMDADGVWRLDSM